MIKWLREYSEANPQTKYFVLNGLIYGLAIIITTVYCYGRLDFVRSYRAPTVANNEKQITQETSSQPPSTPK